MSIIHFGKFKGKDINEIPTPYLIWLSQQDWFENDYAELLHEINDEISYRDRWSVHIYDENCVGKDYQE